MVMMVSNNNGRIGVFFSPNATIGGIYIKSYLDKGYKAKFFKQGNHLTLFWKEDPRYPIPGRWRHLTDEDGYCLASFSHGDNPDFQRMPEFRRSLIEREPSLTPGRCGIRIYIPQHRRDL